MLNEIIYTIRNETKRDIEDMKKLLKQRTYENLTCEDIYKLNRHNNEFIYNCYGYAIYGLKINDLAFFSNSNLFNLGFSTEFDLRDCKNKHDVELLLKQDMKAINMKLRRADEFEIANPLRNENKIGLYLERSKNENYVYEDYHFIVQDKQSKDWYQKMGFDFGIYKFTGKPPKVLRYEGFKSDYRLAGFYIVENKNKKEFCEPVRPKRDKKVPTIGLL